MKILRCCRWIFLSAVILLFAPVIPLSQADEQIKKAPLEIESDKMIAQKEMNLVEFTGNVKAVQEGSTLLADSIKIYFNGSDTKNKNNSQDSSQANINKIVSTGNVRYSDGERKAFADKAVYTTDDEILVLTGKTVKLLTGPNFVEGRKVTLFRKSDKVIVESGEAKRVQAQFNPENNSPGKIKPKPDLIPKESSGS